MPTNSEGPFFLVFIVIAWSLQVAWCFRRLKIYGALPRRACVPSDFQASCTKFSPTMGDLDMVLVLGQLLGGLSVFLYGM